MLQDALADTARRNELETRLQSARGMKRLF